MVHRISTPIKEDDIKSLRAGDEVLLTGTIYTARDMAHMRLADIINNGRKISLNLEGQVIYYSGPTPARPGRVIGSCGPTTSSRMDDFTPLLLAYGIGAMIGKGPRSDKVRHAIIKRRSIYFLATGGLGALFAERVASSKCVLFKDLGPEAIYRLEVKDLPLIVGIDMKGNDIYEEAQRKKS